MQIEKKQNHSTPSLLAAKSSGTKVAEEYAATFPTRLALARWTRGGDIPHVHCFEHQLPMRAGWYAQAQRQFQAWLESGGFHRAEPGSLDDVIVEATQPDGKSPALSRKVVVHGGPRVISQPTRTPFRDDACDPAHPRQIVSGVVPVLPAMKSFPDEPGDGRQK